MLPLLLIDLSYFLRRYQPLRDRLDVVWGLHVCSERENRVENLWLVNWCQFAVSSKIQVLALEFVRLSLTQIDVHLRHVHSINLVANLNSQNFNFITDTPLILNAPHDSIIFSMGTLVIIRELHNNGVVTIAASGFCWWHTVSAKFWKLA